MNANRVVSKEKLLRAVPGNLDSSDLSKSIYILRDKLGRENEWRIRTVRGEGYTYVTQEHSSAETGRRNTDMVPLVAGGRSVFPYESAASQSKY